MSVYYPYIRARQFDVIAVGKAAPTIATKGKIVPLLEPVQANTTTLEKRADVFASEGLSVALVMNPKVGDLVGAPNATAALLEAMRDADATVIPALIIDEGTQAADLKAFQKHVLPGESAIFVHRGVPTLPAAAAAVTTATNVKHLFLEGMTGDAHEKTFAPRARVRDGFKIQVKNALYPPQSFFDDLHLRYTKLGFTAFGDFVTVGQAYKVGGGPAYAIAIHMTEATSTGIVCHHFLSKSNATSANAPGKFGEAAAKLAAYCKKNPGKLDFSPACKELLAAQANGTFPGLPSLKRLSIQHHLELMSTLV